jgi:hypothetical protein
MTIPGKTGTSRVARPGPVVFRILLPSFLSSCTSRAVDTGCTRCEVSRVPEKSRFGMADIRDIPVASLDSPQATELALLVELEARWENLRGSTSRPTETPPTTQDLHSKQKAYEAFRLKLAVYNKRYRPAHVPELLLNTPIRLGTWCKAMRDLYARVENEPQVHAPVHLVEKAFRWADRLAVRISAERVSRPMPPATVREAIQNLDGLGCWCASLAPAQAPDNAQQPLVA